MRTDQIQAQPEAIPAAARATLRTIAHLVEGAPDLCHLISRNAAAAVLDRNCSAVSYTHLTLPTKA